MSKDAKVTIGVKGAKEAEQKLKQLEESFKGFGKELGAIFAGTVKDIAHVASELGQVDPSSAAQKFRDYRQTVTEFSIATGRSVDSIKAKFADLAGKTLLPDDQIAKFSETLAKTTFDFGDSTKAIQALRAAGLDAGKSLDEMAPIAETLRNSLGTTFSEMPEELGQIEAAANKLGATGGPAALQDQIVALGGALNQISVHGAKDMANLTAALAAIGKGLRPEQAKMVQQQLVSRFTQGGEQMRMNLGIKREDFYDENGQIKVTQENIERLKQFYVKRAGGNVAEAKRLASFNSNLGPMLASALFRPGLMADMSEASAATPTNKAQTDLDRLDTTNSGKDIGSQVARDIRTREELGGKTNTAQQAAVKALPNDPIARYFTMNTGGSILSHGFDALVSAGGGAAGLAAYAKLFGGKAAQVAAGATEAAGGAAAAGGEAAAAGTGAKILLGTAGIALSQVFRAGDNPATQDYFANIQAANEAKAKKQASERSKAEAAQGDAEHARSAAARALAGNPIIPPINVKVVLQDDTGTPHKVVAIQKGKAGAQ